MSRSLKLYLIPVLILLAVTLPHLEQGEFRRDTVRYAAVSLQMWQGGSLLTPYLNPERPYFGKPPMAFWIHGLFLKVFGRHLAVARAPSILAAIGALVFSMLSVRNLGTRREAVVSGIVLALTYEFFRRTREISLDFWQLFFLMGAVWLITQAIRTGARSSVILSGIPIGLALLCKPLVAFATLPIFAVWLAISGRAALIRWILLGILPIALLIAAPWHIYMYSTFGGTFAHQYFITEVVERASRADQPTSVDFYLRESLLTYWPWMIALGCAVYWRVRKRALRRLRRDLVVLAGSWVVISLIALTLFADRKPNYALPLYPMLSWIAAWGLCRSPVPYFRDWYERALPWLAPAVIALFVVAAIAPIQFQRPPEESLLAFVQWIQANKLDASQLAYDNLNVDEVAYVYLKTGKWMKSLPLARATADVGQTNFLIVRKFAGRGKRESFHDVLFSAGLLRVSSEPIR